MFIDLTHTIKPGMPVYPGTAAPSFTASGTLTRTGYRETEMTIASHTGTHMDAPAHLLREGANLDVLPVAQFCGKATVLDVSALPTGGVISADYLRLQDEALRCAEFVLFYTGWEKKWGGPDYCQDGFPVLDEAAAKYLVSRGLKGVGTDALSVDALAGGEFPAHRVLLGGGLVIVESLRLKKVAGRTDIRFFALPLKFEKADGAPVRAVAELCCADEGKETEAELA